MKYVLKQVSGGYYYTTDTNKRRDYLCGEVEDAAIFPCPANGYKRNAAFNIGSASCGRPNISNKLKWVEVSITAHGDWEVAWCQENQS